MQFIKIKTRKFLPPKDDLFSLLNESLPSLKEGDIVFITSKIVAIHQGRCVKISPNIKKDDLVLKEADWYLPRDLSPKKRALLTIKDHTLLPSAGIDTSNGRGFYILWPKNPIAAAKEIWQILRKKFSLAHLGVIITDSHSIPLRYGTVGISIGHYGFEPLIDYTGRRGVFGGRLKYAKANVADSLAAAGTLLMGEADEQTPVIIARDCDLLTFTEEDTAAKLVTNMEEDIYAPLLKVFDRRKLTKQTKSSKS